MVIATLNNGTGNGHSHEQGLRVHHLTNLGGLIALAGLDLEPPDFLLGALLSVAQETSRLSAAQRELVAKIGRNKLDQRATGKRAWKSWHRAQDLHALTLSGAQVRDIIEALGRQVPTDSTQLVLALSEALTEVRA
ncbi:MAG: conjugal transfer protein TraD [Candidatus Binataceae bacterium]